MADEPKRPRGRPRVPEALNTHVGTRLPAKTYDRLFQSAKAEDKSIAALVRQWLTLKLPKP